MRYDCAGEQTVQRITSLATKVGLERSVFLAAVQTAPEEIAAIEPKPHLDEQPEQPPPAVDDQEAGEQGSEPVIASPRREPKPAEEPQPAITPPESPQAANEHEKLHREILGYPEPKPRRRWQR